MDDLGLLTTLLAVLLLVAAHHAAALIHPEKRLDPNRWRSFAGGIGVGYVFIFILPELAAEQAGRAQDDELAADEREVFLTALVGLAAFYGLDRLAQQADEVHPRWWPSLRIRSPGFWLHILGFGIYNAIIGFVLGQRQEFAAWDLAAYSIALSMHVFVNDHSLQLKYGSLYRRSGRWILAGLVVFGWSVGVLLEDEGTVTALIFAFLAGGMILNILKQELPAENRSRFGAFLLGILIYMGLGAAQGL